MAEAISLGASIIAFIGLAGQIAQGCSYVRTLIDDIDDAPDDMRGLQREIRLYEGTNETFREALSNLEESGIPTQQSSYVQLALKFGNETLSNLTEFIERKTKSGRRLGQVRFAFGKGKCAKHAEQIERAKEFLSMAQAGIILALEHEHTLSNRAANRVLETLTSQNEINSDTIERIPSYLDRIALDTRNLYSTVDSIKNEVSGQRHDLHTAIDNILIPLLTQRLNAFTSMFSESFRAIEEVRYTTRQTREAVENLTCTSDILRGLSGEMSQIVQITFRSVLTEFYLDIDAETSLVTLQRTTPKS
ncbi:hypothetical protein HYALB_00003121 [Hymenoscyphus albidus]|uniref:Fungal N-terminal domain-containing protein n=1 Tax=Hymenoscyphus albidus TaxID=595503 RepID=A0A9N9PQS8_9HELO|nr:hypothetical protein HYALB_00003121 [Hymenoscyphus albidus]